MMIDKESQRRKIEEVRKEVEQRQRKSEGKMDRENIKQHRRKGRKLWN